MPAGTSFLLRPSLFARVVLENRPVRSDDAMIDPVRVGQPRGHPPGQPMALSACGRELGAQEQLPAALRLRLQMRHDDLRCLASRIAFDPG